MYYSAPLHFTRELSPGGDVSSIVIIIIVLSVLPAWKQGRSVFCTDFFRHIILIKIFIGPVPDISPESQEYFLISRK